MDGEPASARRSDLDALATARKPGPRGTLPQVRLWPDAPTTAPAALAAELERLAAAAT